MPYNKVLDFQEEILAQHALGKNSREIADYLKDNYGDFGIKDDSLGRQIRTIIQLLGDKEIVASVKANPFETKKTDQYYIPKILLFDIETSPMRAFVWGHWKNNVALSQVISNTYVLCWSAKWLGHEKVMSGVLTQKEAKNEDDKRIITDLWKLLDEAEIVIGHNHEKFDIPRINSRFIIHGLQRPAPFKSVDTLRVVRKQFGFNSNKLDALAGYFGLEHKLETSFSLWANSMSGDEDSLKYMSEYCNRDVTLLEEIYLKLRPWISGHANIGLFFDETKLICPNCGSTNLSDGKPYYTTVGRYQTYRCKCGAIARVKKSDNINTNLLRSV